MSHRGALARASLLGLCLIVMGAGAVALVTTGPMDIARLMITAVISIWKLCVVAIGFSFIVVGAVWMVRPTRALRAIDHNNPYRRVS